MVRHRLPDSMSRLVRVREVASRSYGREHSPVAMADHISAEPLGQVGPDAVQLLGGRHGVEGELLHVRLDQAILTGDTNTRGHDIIRFNVIHVCGLI